ncbi:hypothetical protein CNEO2_510022 [Clostridium neonatale]|nr:hypothetical protein CNEO2_510022 [Clostridium neonatale]
MHTNPIKPVAPGDMLNTFFNVTNVAPIADQIIAA